MKVHAMKPMTHNLSVKPKSETSDYMEHSGRHYLDTVLRNWFVIFIFAVLTGGISYYLQLQQPMLYQSSVKVFVGNALNTPDPEVSSFESAERLALTYAELTGSYALLTLAVQDIDLDSNLDILKERVSVNVISDTSILVINVTDNDPQRAADLANAIADALIVITPSTLTPEQEQQISRIREQINSLEGLISLTNIQHQESIVALQQNPENLNTVIELTRQLNTSYGSLALLEDQYRDLSNRISRIEIIDDARPNFEALGLSPIIIAVSGAFLGIVVAVAGVILLDIFDTTLRTENDIKDTIDAPVFGVINGRRSSQKAFAELATSGDLSSTGVNSQYRAVLSNIIFSTTDDSHNNSLYAIVSPQRGNGRTFTAVNLAVAAVSSGLKVLLVDFDSQNPSVHTCFRINPGDHTLAYLLDYLAEHPEAVDDEEAIAELYETVVVSPDNYDNLSILPGHATRQQSRTLPRLQAAHQFLNAVLVMYDYDIIFMDTPASSHALDAVNLVAITKSDVLLIIERRATTQAVASKVASDLRRVGHDISGVIIT
jgi:capsular polysaccharide biosynthesis protein/MinD-like ATPase involved in chromosome partitioning or flagellar assembly